MLCLVTPALEDANNGNWQTAKRWAHLLSHDYQVQLTNVWPLPEGAQGALTGLAADVMVALHARRSAASIERFVSACPGRPLAVVLTGTDLYQDIGHDAKAQASLGHADRLIVLHEGAVQDVPEAFRGKALVCLQSTTARAALTKSSRLLRAVMVGHLRAVKAPETYFGAAKLLAGRSDILLDHIGAPLDAQLGAAAAALSFRLPTYRWLGPLPHEATRRRVQRAHVLVHPSLLEGGAHVVIEAICSGTAVLASRIPGNVGLLGADYGGYFEPGDAAGLAELLLRCRDDRAILEHLTTQCAARAPRFTASNERATLLGILSDLMETSHP